MSDAENIPAKFKGSVRKGLLLGLLLHVLQLAIVPGIQFLFGVFYPQHKEPLAAGILFSAYAWSVTQFLYLGPAAWLAFRHGEPETGKGLLIIGAIGVLLNGACDVLVLSPRR